RMIKPELGTARGASQSPSRARPRQALRADTRPRGHVPCRTCPRPSRVTSGSGHAHHPAEVGTAGTLATPSCPTTGHLSPSPMYLTAPPGATGLYHPANEHDSCGIALVAKLWGEASHAVVEKALDALENLEHRGAEGADPGTGDGAGILIQIPDAFLRAAAAGVELPQPGRYGVGVCYLPSDPERRVVIEQLIDETIASEGQRVLWWRDVPVDDRHVGATARLSAPVIRQVLVEASEDIHDQDAFERKLYVIRRLIERGAGRDLALPSFSSRTIVYKGMLTAPQLPRYFTDLRDPRVASRLALAHARFSTNTFPSWELAHPYRMIAHNGEVNTLRGNINWMRARESQLASELFGEDLEKVMPVAQEGGSDS